MTLQILKDIKPELKRFEKRLHDAIQKLTDDEGAIYGCKETGAVKRAAMDLKRELTKITQSY